MMNISNTIKFKSKHKGSATIIAGILLIIALAIWFIVPNIVINQNTLAEQVQDDLYFANTSTYKYIDKRLLGNDEGYLVIGDPEEALQIFKEKLKHNMRLDNNFQKLDSSTIQGKVNIKDFIIYNVQGDNVDIYTLSPYGIFNKTQKDLSKEKVVTPNNYNVGCTTVHTTISFNIKGLQGEISEKDVTVDTDIINYKE